MFLISLFYITINSKSVLIYSRRLPVIIANEEVKSLIAEIPEGHKHLRTTIELHDGRTFTFQEATIANLVRAYIEVKTHPVVTNVHYTGRNLAARKDGYAEWQLLGSE
jgi:hypothetical protein